MREMKDSGVEWIGQIPKDWSISPLKYNYEVVAGATPESSKSDYWDGDIVWITPADFKTKDVYVERGSRYITKLGFDSCSTSIIPKGNIIFSKRAPIGSVVINSKDLCTNQGCLSCINKDINVNNKYYYYVLSIYTDVFELFGSGTTFKEISGNVFSNIILPYPCVEVQNTIVNFLDEKCSEIDTLTSDIQKQIDILEQYKKSVIMESVTKGLNPDAEMKDSGIEWVGQIPVSWHIHPVSIYFDERKNKNHGRLAACEKIRDNDFLRPAHDLQIFGERRLVEFRFILDKTLLHRRRKFESRSVQTV